MCMWKNRSYLLKEAFNGGVDTSESAVIEFEINAWDFNWACLWLEYIASDVILVTD